jgi:hypothetical protein
VRCCLIDEMQNLDAAPLGAICMALHRVSQRDPPVALAGAGLPTLPSMLRAAKSHASRLFSYHTLSSVPAVPFVPSASSAEQLGRRVAELASRHTRQRLAIICTQNTGVWFRESGGGTVKDAGP